MKGSEVDFVSTGLNQGLFSTILMQKLHVVAMKALVFDMPKVKILPHPEICPEGAEFDLMMTSLFVREL